MLYLEKSENKLIFPSALYCHVRGDTFNSENIVESGDKHHKPNKLRELTYIRLQYYMAS